MTELERLRVELAATQAALACAATGVHSWHDFSSGVAAADIAKVAGPAADLPGFGEAVQLVCKNVIAASALVASAKAATESR